MPLFARPALKHRLDSIEEQVRALVSQGKSDAFLLVVPNRIAQRRLERELVEAASGRAIAKPNILTLADFAERLCSVAFPNLSLLSDAKAAVLIEQSIRELLSAHMLAYFERAGDPDSPNAATQAFPIPRGTFELVVNTIRELKENGITVEDIEADLARTDGDESTELRRATDICEIYRSYHGKLVSRGFMDTYGQTLLLNERYKSAGMTADFAQVFPNVSQIFIDGFYYLESPTLKLLRAIGGVEKVQTVISLDYREDNPELFGGVIELRGKLFEQGFALSHGGGEAAHHAKTNALLRRHLFAAPEDGFEVQDASGISYFEASDPLTEVEEIARQIKLIASTSETDLSRIVIGVPVIEDYSMLVEEVFQRCGIPVEIADRQRLDRAPLFLTLLSLLDLARPTPRLREVLQALGSPYFEFSASGSKIDIQNLLSVLIRHKPSGDLSGWLRSLQSRIDTLSDAIEDSDDPDEQRTLQNEVENTERSIRDLEQIRSLLAPFQPKMTPAGFVRNLRELMQRLNLRQNLLANDRETIAAHQLEQDASAFRALTRLVEELESLFRLLGIGDEQRSLAFFVERLKAASIYTRYTTRVREQAVIVAPLSQAIAAPADHLFVAGLAEGALPRAYQPQVFLMGHHQRGEQKQLREDRVLFYQALMHAGQQVTLSAPMRTLGGADVSRSIFLDALSETVKWQIQEPAEGIFSWRDLHERTGELARLDANWQTTVKPIRQASALLTQLPGVLETERIRALPEDSIYRGKLDLAQLSELEREALERARSRVWSVTQLELYAACPFKYFAERVLGLGQEEEREEGLDARDRGSLLHEILRDFMTERRQQRRDHLQNLPESEIEGAYQELRETAERHFARIEREHPNRAEHPFWRLDRERLLDEELPRENVLRRFVNRERDLAPYEHRPKFFEVSFGTKLSAKSAEHFDPELSQDEPVEIGGIKFRGRIDRIDHDDERTFAVIDYKTGKTVSFRDIQRGTSLQLPIYIRIAEELLGNHFPEIRGVAALYHRITQSDSPRELGLAVKEEMEHAFEKLSGRSGILKSPQELEELIASTIEAAQQYVDGIATGNFRLTTAELRKTSCKYCPYNVACRVKEAEELGVLA